MITKHKLLLLSVLLLFSSCAKSQESETTDNGDNKEQFSLIDSELYELNLKGKVKIVASYIKYNNKEEDKKDFNQGLRHYDIQTPWYREYNEWGGLKKFVLEPFVDTLTLTVTDTLRFSITEYLDKEDKLSKFIDKKFNYPILNPHPIWSNHRQYFLRTVLNNEYWQYEFIQDYQYKYNNEGYPVEEKESYIIDTNHNGIHDNNEEKVLRKTTIFSYDEDNKILSKDISFIPDGFGMDTYLIESFEVSSSSVVRYEYRYDEKDRITEILIYVNEQLARKTKYIYHLEGWVMKREIDAYVASMFHENGWKFVVEFNKNGDFTKGWTYNYKGELINERIYEYEEYDSHNNWLKCNLYTNNDTSRPAVVYKRRIEYYED